MYMLLLYSLLLFLNHIFNYENQAGLTFRERILISEAFQVSELFGKKLWKNWNETDLTILLIKDSTEYLINHPEPGKEFELLYYDTLLHSDVYCRKRIFENSIISVFPIDGVPVIAADLSENTGKTAAEWIITILHEHFHQIQYSQKNYYRRADTLNLSGSDIAGIEMLNYPFPYNDDAVNKQYEILTASLLKLVQPFPFDSRLFNRDFRLFQNEMTNFKKILSIKDYEYFQFQLWKEGIAMYTGYKIADMLDSYRPSDEFASLGDYESFTEIADTLRENIYNELEECKLKEKKNVCFYSFGASLGFLLDRVNKKWKEKYFNNFFSLEQLITK